MLHGPSELAPTPKGSQHVEYPALNGHDPGGVAACSTVRCVEPRPRRGRSRCSSPPTLPPRATAIVLLNRQLNSQAKTFEQEGGFSERLYRVRSEARVREGSK